jgi:hypothetical protein
MYPTGLQSADAHTTEGGAAVTPGRRCRRYGQNGVWQNGGFRHTHDREAQIIMSPSRELALQTLKVVKEFGRGTDLRTILLVGGDSLEERA